MQITAGLGIQPSMLRQWRTALSEVLPQPRLAGWTGSLLASPKAHSADQAAEIAHLRRGLDRTRIVTFVFIEQHATTWPVYLVCRVLGVSPRGYYEWRLSPGSARSASNRQFLEDVRRVYVAHHMRYGAPRVHTALRAEGRTVSRERRSA